MPRNDVAIYAPRAAGLYDLRRGRAGGSERQTVLLARALVARGVRTAHIVLEVGAPAPGPAPTLVERPEMRSGAEQAIEPLLIWRAMAQADAATYVFRSANVAVGIGAAFCRARRRGFVFATANDSDFKVPCNGAPGLRGPIYRWGGRGADAIVVQTEDQARMARERFPAARRVEEIPSFVEEADPATGPGEAFVWVGRLVDYKRPLEYVELARAVPEARFWMVALPTLGDTTPELAAELERRAAEVPNLEMLPPRPQSEMSALLGRSVAIVNTSSTEGMPNVFLEAWARGVPALSLEFDADRRIARRGLGIAAEGSFDAFVAGARTLWTGRDDRSAHAASCRAYIHDVHGPEAVGGRWAELLEAAARR